VDSGTLLFDVGNTRIKWGVLEDDAIRRTGAIDNQTLRGRGIDALIRKLPDGAGAAIACNVAGADFGRRLARAVGLLIGGDLHFVTSNRSGFGLTSAYRRPRALGVDRWVAMIGARAEFRGALLIVDTGTAVTLDAVDREGMHLGGQILPGLKLMADALARDTSDIGVSKQTSRAAKCGEAEFATTTAGAVAAGAVNALCGAVERAAKSLRAQGHRPKVILTGGDASRILSGLGAATLHRPHLVLQGLAHIVQSDA